MKRIQSTVTYTVPHWPFCNVDRHDIDATPSDQVCQFCVKTKAGYRCALYDQQLMSDGVQIAKTKECCRATAGFRSTIVADPAPSTTSAPSIPPADLIKQTIELYSKTTNDLIAQGYPRAMAELAAKKFILTSK